MMRIQRKRDRDKQIEIRKMLQRKRQDGREVGLRQ